MLVQEKENQIIFFESPRKFMGVDVILVLYGLSIVGFCVYALYKPFDDTPYWVFILLGLLHVFMTINQFSLYFGANIHGNI